MCNGWTGTLQLPSLAQSLIMTVYVGFKEKLLARPGNAAVNACDLLGNGDSGSEWTPDPIKGP